MDKNRKAPRLRFPGFTDDWEQRKLGDIIDKLTGGASIAPDDYVNEGVRTIPKGAVNDTGIADMSGCKYVSDEFFKKNISSKTSTGELVTSLRDLVPTAPNMGRIVRIIGDSEDFLMPQGVYSIILKENNDEDFLIAYSNSPEYRKIISTEKNGSTQVHIRNGEFLNIDIPVPSYYEQKKIGESIKNLDNLITLHQRKCDKLVEYKKGMLQKMFPQNGAAVPEIRFPEFTGDWEQRKLSNLIIEYRETVDSDCTLPILTSSKTEGVVLQEEHFGRAQNHDITGYNILPRNYCTYRNRSDGVDFTFNINRCCDKGIISKFYPVFYGNNSDIFFISMVLNYCDEVVHEIAYTCTGTGQKVLSFLDLQKIYIRVPGYDEQKKISKYFEQIDKLITLHQRKFEKYKELKKGLLQILFL